jgi:membrane protein
MQFAALAIICLLPFLFLVAAATGADLRRTIVARLGLNAHAAQEVNSLIYPTNHHVVGLSLAGIILVVLGALGIASTLEGWYQKVYDLPAAHGRLRQLVNRVLWVAGMVLYIALQALVGKIVGPLGGHVLSFVLGFIVAVAFFWWTIRILLRGRIGWRRLLPSALATGVCVTGLSLFSSLLFSEQVVSSQRTYGPIGVVMVLITYLVGLAVCLHLGAVIGWTWSERHASPPPGPNS